MKATRLQFVLLLFLLGQLRALAVPSGSTNVDLGVSITPSTNTISLSNTVTFTLVLTNAGSNNVTGTITVSNIYSAGYQYSGDCCYSGNYTPGPPGVWTVPGLPAFSAVTRSVTMYGITMGRQTNTVSVLAPSGYTDTNANNNTASTVVTVAGPPTSDFAIAELVLTNLVAATNITVPRGTQLTFVINLTNLGPTSVFGMVTATALVPAGFTVVTNSAGSYGGDTYNPTNGMWIIPQVTTSNGYTLTITAVATSLGTFTVTSSVAVPPGTTDPNLTNNNSSVMVTVRAPKANLAIGKIVNTNIVNVGQPVVFTLSVTNLGTDNITSNIGPVTVTDLLPAGLQYLTDNGGGAYTASSGTWTMPALGVAMPVSLQITASAAAAGKYTNIAVVNVPPGVMDTNLNNNTGSAVVTVTGTNQATNTGPFTLSGYVRGCATNGAGFAYVTITLTGATNLTTLTDTNGFYSFTNLSAGTYAVTPAQTGNTFTPANAIVTLSTNTSVPAFVAGQSIIQGVITYGSSNGPGIPGITVQTIGQAERSVLTDANGRYIFTNCAAGVYTVVVPATNGFTFSPMYSPALGLDATNCNAQFNSIAGPRKVQLAALEVTQVIQDWSNSVPLVSAKKTYVRAHLQWGYYTNQFGFPAAPPGLLLTGARLYNTALPGAPQWPLNPDGALLVVATNAPDVRGNWASTLNFKLPPSWCTGTISLQFVCTNNVTVVPTNTVPANSTVTVTFTPTPILPVKYFGWNWTNGGTLQELSQAAYEDLPGRLVSIYPVPDATKTAAVQTPVSVLNIPLPIPPAIAATQKLADWVLLNSNAKLALYQAIDTLLGGRFGGGSNWIYFGAIAGPSPTGTTGWAKAVVTGSNTINSAGSIYVSSAFVVSDFYTPYRHTPAHEIGHNLGRPHDVMANAKGVCTEEATNNTPVYPLFQNVPPPGGNIKPAIGPMTKGTNGLIYGLDTLTLTTSDLGPVVNPTYYFDIMSYCKSAPLDRWISPYTYLSLRSNITSNFTPPPAPPAPGPSRQWFFIRGYIDFTSGLGSFLPFWTVSSTSTNPPPGSPAGPYQVVVYDPNGVVLETIPFAPDPYVVEEGDIAAFDEGEFLVPVPVMPNMHAVEIINTENSQSVATITASAYTPSVTSVTLSGPNNQPFTGTGPLVVSWQSQDSDPNAQLLYTIQYSTDGGITWETLDMDISGFSYGSSSSYQIDSLYLPASENALIRVMASDGFNTSSPMNSSPLVIPNHPPSILINTPGNRNIFTVDQQIFFDATVSDPQDGPLDGNNVQWSSSIDGFLGYGAVFELQAGNLSEGIHTITVTATDNESLTSSATVQIFVLHQSQPQLSIQTAGNQVMLTWPSSVTNFQLLSTSDLASGQWTPVGTLPVAADAQQTVTLNLTDQPQFFILQMK